MPSTSHSVRCVSRIHALLPAIHCVAIQLRIRSIVARTAWNGSTSFTRATRNRSEHQNSVFSASSVAAITPRRKEGRNVSMCLSSGDATACAAQSC